MYEKMALPAKEAAMSLQWSRATEDGWTGLMKRMNFSFREEKNCVAYSSPAVTQGGGRW